MKKKLAIGVVVGCLLILVNMSIAGIPLEKTATRGENVEEPLVSPFHSSVDRSYSEERDLPVHTEEISAEEKELIGHIVFISHADAGGPYSGETDVSIQFDGSNSYVGLIGIVTYEWDFGDGTNGYGQNPTHSYSASGVYYTTLTITKNYGETYQDIAPVYINQEGNHLLPYGGCFYHAEKDESILFDGSQSISNNADAEITEWVWHFGDGTTDYGKRVTHSYSEEKVYLVTLETRDNNGCKRQDVLHADIGVSYSSIEDFFITSNAELTTILDILFNRLGTFILYPLLFVKIYTNYNGYEQTIPLSNSYMLPLTIDVNHDGDGDVKVNNLNFFKPVISQSQFNGFPWFAFETTFSDIEKTSEDITTDDDFTICLQFSLQIMEGFLDLQEPVVRIGYQSVAGDEKPSHFSATHIFRPYILPRILNGGNAVQPVYQNINAYPVIQGTTITSLQTTTQSFKTTGQQPIMQGFIKGSTPTKTSEKAIAVATKEKIQQTPAQPNNSGGEEWDLITENGIRVESSDADHFSLFISFSNTIGTTKTKFAATFESFTATTLMHRRTPSIRDVNLQGSDDSALTLSITRENQYGSAKIGLLINPLQNLGFHMDIGKLPNNARHITFDIDNPPENIVLFTENEDNQGGQNSHYFYLKHLPTSVDFEWLPRLDEGYILLTKEYASDELIVGICDDLDDPYTNFYMTNLPTQMSLSWQITSNSPVTITFYSDNKGLTLNAELKDVTQNEQTIDFHATSHDGFDIKLLFDFSDGYFELQRSTKNIDFNFSVTQEKGLLNISGNFQGGPDEGFVFHFKDLQNGSIKLSNDVAFDVKINIENFETETILNTDLAFTAGGDVDISWNENLNFNVDLTSSISLSNFVLQRNENFVNVDEITISSGGQVEFIYEYGTQVLELGGNGQVSVSLFEAEVGYWAGRINSASAGGSFDILLKPTDKYYEVQTSNNIDIIGFNIEYDRPESNQFDLLFEIDLFSVDSSGTTWFDFSGVKPKFNFDNDDNVDLNNLHLSVGSGTTQSIDFTISNAHLENDGTIYGEWDQDNLFIDATLDLNWDVEISTYNFGDWEIHGNIEGSASMEAEWDDGSGFIEFIISDTGIAHSLEIIHDGLTLNLATFNFEPGTITFDWKREQYPTNGHLNIINNGVDGNLNLCKISYPTSGLELELGNINVVSGNLYMNWSRTLSQKMFYIDNGMTVDMDLIKATKAGKTIALEGLGLKPGEFKFTWDTTNKMITVNNGIQDFGPSCYYEDVDRKLEIDLTNFEHDYSKTMTLKWYETGDSISGVYLDTDNHNLVDWIEFSSIKYDASGNTGRKIALGGLKANDFYINKVGDGIEINGELYIISHLTYSKLVNDQWKDLEVQWDLNLDGVGYIEFDIDSAFNLDVLDISASFLGVDIITNFDWKHPTLPHYVKFSWDVDFDLNGNVFIDTDWDEIDATFTIKKDTASYLPKWGVTIGATSMKADDYMIYWDFSNPPGQWVLGYSGLIEPGTLNSISIAWNGNWYNALSGGTPI